MVHGPLKARLVIERLGGGGAYLYLHKTRNYAPVCVRRFDARAIPRPSNMSGGQYTRGGSASVHVDDGGYDATWYARIAADAGDHYRVPNTSQPIINPKLSTDRFKHMRKH